MVLYMQKVYLKRIIYKAVTIFLYFLSWFIYFSYISYRFQGVPGYYFEDINLYKFMSVLPLILMLGIVISYKVDNIADIIFIATSYIVYLPLIYLCFPRLDILGPIIVNFFVTIFLWSIFRNLTIIKARYLKEPKSYFYLFLTFLIISFFVVFIKIFGFKTSIDYVNSLYEIRYQFKGDINTIKAYIFMLAEYFFVPLALFVIFNIKKLFYKIVVSILTLIIVIQIFYQSALKSALFIIPFLILGYIFLRNKDSIYLEKIIMIISVMLILSTVIVIYFKLPLLFKYILEHSLRRFLIAPPVNAYYHIVYTIDHFGWINIGNRKNMGNIISNFYYLTDGNAPAGLVADVLSRWGIIFFIAFPIIYTSYLSILRNILMGLKLSDQFILFGFYIYVISNTSFITTQISYGMLFMILIVIFLRIKFNKIKREIITNEE